MVNNHQTENIILIVVRSESRAILDIECVIALKTRDTTLHHTTLRYATLHHIILHYTSPHHTNENIKHATFLNKCNKFPSTRFARVSTALACVRVSCNH